MPDRELQLENLRRRALGWGLACEMVDPGVDIGRDLVLADRAGRQDFAIVDGVANLGQSLQIALTTLLGSDLFNTDFGFDGLNALAQETHPVLVRERVRVSVIRTLHRDPRVRRVLDIQVGPEPMPNASPEQKKEQLSANERILDVRVAFEVITGEQASLSLGRVAPGG